MTTATAIIGAIIFGAILSPTLKGVLNYLEKQSRSTQSTTSYRVMCIKKGDHPVIIYTSDGGHSYWSVSVYDPKNSRPLLPGSIRRYVDQEDPDMLITYDPWSEEANFPNIPTMIDAVIDTLNMSSFRRENPSNRQPGIDRCIAQAETQPGMPPPHILQTEPKNRDTGLQGPTIIQLVKQAKPTLGDQRSINQNEHEVI